MKKSFLALLLGLSMLLAPLVSCGNDEKPTPGENNTGENTTEAPTEEQTEYTNDRDDLPEDLDLGGKTFTIFSIAQWAAGGEFDQDSELIEGDVIKQAVFDRNALLKERLHCTIKNVESLGDTNTDEMLTKVQMMNLMGTAEYQLLVTAGYRMCPLAQQGLLADLAQLTSIDLNKDYYSQGYNTALSIGNAQYLATGTFTMGYYRYMMVNLFNKKLFRAHGIDEPYDLVRNQEWTYEKMNEIVSQLYYDTDGNSQKDKDDTYGYVIMTGNNGSFTDAFMSACDLHMISKDDDNYYTVNINSERYSDAVDEVLELLFGQGTLSGENLNAEDVYDKFGNSTAAMITTRLYGVEDKRVVDLGNTDGYGILPIPKMNLDQADYISYVQDQCFLFGIPGMLGGNSLTQVSQLFEAFASESYRIVKPAYYEKALTSRYVYDPDSVEMLDLIGSHVYVDPVNVYLMPNVINTASFRKIYATGQNTVTSMLASVATNEQLKQAVGDMNDAFRALKKTGN